MLSPERLVAHRGYRRHYPENTRLSIRKAIEAGARHVEFDIQLSADAVPFVYHDATLRRLSARSGSVLTHDAKTLRGYTAHEPQRFGNRYADERIAGLDDLVSLMQRHPEVHFYPELKEESLRHHGTGCCLERVAAVLAPVFAQCTLISFDCEALAQARDYGFVQVGPVLRDWDDRNRAIAALRADTIFIDRRALPARGSLGADAPVVVYEIDDRDEAEALLRRGIDKIETFAIGEMLGMR